MSTVLSKLLEDLATGRLRIVDLTQPLSPQTPLLPLPSQWNNTPAFKIWELSRYDERGPAWYWNGFETGEHTGTHFDAPVHWVSGKDLADNTVDRIPPQKFVGPACVIDVREEVAKNPNYLVTAERVRRCGQSAAIAQSSERKIAAYPSTISATGSGLASPRAGIATGLTCSNARLRTLALNDQTCQQSRRDPMAVNPSANGREHGTP